MRDKSHDEYMIERFRADPAFAASLVSDILEDGDDQGELKTILEWIAAAGLKMSVGAVAQGPKPRKRVKAATTKAAKHRSVTAKAVKRLPGRGRVRHSAAVHV